MFPIQIGTHNAYTTGPSDFLTGIHYTTGEFRVQFQMVNQKQITEGWNGKEKEGQNHTCQNHGFYAR
jgi:hypothetical protein